MLGRLSRTNAPAAVVLIRLAVGWIFLSEGIQKFLYPDLLGVGRFVRVGLPFPQVMGPFAGRIEIVRVALVLLGLFTRVAALLLLATISVAILSSKIPILFGNGYWIFNLPKLGRYGSWSMSSKARTRSLHGTGDVVSSRRRSWGGLSRSPSPPPGRACPASLRYVGIARGASALVASSLPRLAGK